MSFNYKLVAVVVAILIATHLKLAYAQYADSTAKYARAHKLAHNQDLAIINLKNGQTLHGEPLLNVRFLPRFTKHSTAEYNTARIFVDGEPAGTGDEGKPIGIEYVTSVSLPTDAYANGWHLIGVYLSNARPAKYRVNFVNDISHINVDSMANPTASIVARNETRKPWTVAISTTNVPTVRIRTFHGSGRTIHISWDGKDAKGKSVPDDSYTVAISEGQAVPHLMTIYEGSSS